ncbi:unnamed protein product, partial [Symbiodinium necroappetens]
MPAMSKLSFVAASAAAATAATTFVGVPQPVSRPVALRGTQQRSATGAGLGGALGLGLAGLGLASLSVVPTARASVVRCAYDASQ